jgi:mono/diheme cytochrome c family protein
MRVLRWIAIIGIVAAVGCAGAAAATNVRQPLGAHLTPNSPTGAQIPLRFDSSSSARMIRSTSANLPAATYHDAQAERGEAVFRRSCGTCHPSEEFVGQRFVESWNGRRLFDFYALVRSTMPLNDPGSLKDDEYLAVLGYLLKANHARRGLDSLRADSVALRSHKIAVHLP